ncbi:uncharacterized protein LOC124450957 isoform X2 [Xenia sp. Carnegie-2017]|uniref:uncharacterized protein LOC124450957 isoform X2 n=1 Tax=Xenia sp. Carnegie-2017 TaxID=2897299 RepID=UPI001F037D1A|nr:uncharacterized protein LOC124450957 isoform X2 [Xenia sp. Carnegie-2017]
MVTHIVFQQTSLLLEGFWRNGVGWRNLIIYSNFGLYRKWDNLASIMPFRKATNYKRFNVGEYMRNKRLAWEGNMSKQKKAKCVSQKLKRLDDKVKKLVNELEELDSIRTEFIEGGSRQEEQEEKGFSIGRKAVVRRRNKPTGQGCVESTGRTRRMETMLAANAIHGGSKDDTKPGAIGMLETLENKCKVGDIVKGLEKCSKFTSKVFPKIYKEDLKKFERSEENMLRSIAVYYSKGVMGKEKYGRVYKASSYEQICGSKRAKRVSVAKCPTPWLVPYDRLMQYIKSIDIGKLFSVREHLQWVG